MLNMGQMDNAAAKAVCVACVMATTTACAVASRRDAGTEEPTGRAEQEWYSTNPYDQHGRMTYAAALAADGYGVGWDCGSTYGGLDYSGQLCDGNVATDDTTSSTNHPFFISLWGNARADSNNHHFLRVGGEGLDSACANAVADIYSGTNTALSWRAQGYDAAFQRAIGAISHAIQDSFAPAHTRRGSVNIGKLIDLCSIGQDVSGACRHPESGIPFSPYFPVSADDADDNETLAAYAEAATTEYLIAVANVATGVDANALVPFVQKWFQCPIPEQPSNGIDQTYRDASGRIEILVRSRDSADSASRPVADCVVDPEYQLVGGGGEVIDDGTPGQLLVASYPRPETDWTTWRVISKDHGYSYSRRVRCFAIGMRLLDANGNPYPPSVVRNYLDYRTGTATAKNLVTATASIPTADFQIISGGAFVNYASSGMLLTTSMPVGNAWKAEAKAHRYADTATLTTYAIGLYTGYIPEIDGYLDISGSSNVVYSDGSAYATASIGGGIPDGYVLTGIGGRSTYNAYGRLLTRIAPFLDEQDNYRLNVRATSKDHGYVDAGNTSVYALYLKRQ